MAKVYNPSTSKVDHQVNSVVYKIDPGQTVEVSDRDVEDLLKLLGFLTLVEEDGTMKAPVITQSGELELEDTTKEKVDSEHEKYAEKEEVCDVKVLVKNPHNGRKEVKPCGFITTQYRAMIQHQKNEHTVPKESDSGSMTTTESSKTDNDEDALKPRRGRPRIVQA